MLIKIESPIKVISSNQYLLVIEDATGTRHYWHKEHEGQYGKFHSGYYDGWSVASKIDRAN